MEIDQRLLFNLLLIAILLFANGFFVASEFAIVSIRRTRLSQLAKEGNSDASVALNSIDHMDKSIAATQLGITIASIGLGWVGEATIATILKDLFKFILPASMQSVAAHSIAVPLAFALITLMHVIIGELMPKSIALQFTEKTALVIAKPMFIISKIFAPFIWILNGIGNFLLSLLKIPPAHAGHLVHTVEELDMIINESHKEGVLNDTEKEILTNVFKFSDIQAKQVMVPRPDMTAIPIDISNEELNKIILDTQYTRYPVYEEDMDHITGILHVKDVYPLMVAGAEIKLRELLRKPLLVPETLTIDNLVLEFKKNKAQMAFVIDEFGCVSGLVTLEDVLEEIVGEVQDEFDEEEADIRQIYDDEFVANAMMRIDEFNEYFDLDDKNEEVEDEDIETIGGLVLKNLGHIANEGDTVQIENFEFRVIEVDNARIVKLKIKKLEPENEESGATSEN